MSKQSKMPQEEKAYGVVDEAQEMVTMLISKYPKILWAVNPSEVLVLGVTNKERPPSVKKLAVIHRPSAIMKATFDHFKVPIRFIIEIYFSDWNCWNNERRQWIIFHELCHIPSPVEKGLLKHDVEDFSPIIDAVGVRWWERNVLPSLLSDQPFAFKESLFTSMQVPKESAEEKEQE